MGTKTKSYEQGDRAMNGMFPIGKTVIVCIIALVALTLILTSVRVVRAGQRGVLLHWGAVQQSVLGEGLHFITPIRSKIVKMDVRTLKYEVKATAFSKDLQTANAIIALNYHVLPNEAAILYQEIGNDYQKVIVAPSVQEVVKAVTAKFNAQELIEKRNEVKVEIMALLSDRLPQCHLAVDQVSIVNFDFSDEYEKAIERKQVAQQDALTAENTLKQKKIEADQRIATAKGEAEAIRIQAEAIAKQGGADYLKVRFIDKWNGILPQIVSGDAMNLLVQAPVKQ